MQTNSLTLTALPSNEQIVFKYILSPDEEIVEWVLHCPHCHWNTHARNGKVPQKCGNEKKIQDEQGRWMPVCRHRRLVYKFPKDFDPATCECDTCKAVWFAREAEKLKVDKNKVG
jgi:hypothetical protein